MFNDSPFKGKCILITGGARRVGASIARTLHKCGANIALHYNTSLASAQELRDELNTIRPNSMQIIQADLSQPTNFSDFMQDAYTLFNSLDGLINNASSFFPTPLGTITQDAWDNLIGINLRAPLFLSQAALPHLTKTRGSIINIVDVHAKIPRKGYPVYCVAKSGLETLTRILAMEAAPAVRINAIAPGPILWPEKHLLTEDDQKTLLSETALKRKGNPQDIANAVTFLLSEASSYITGQMLFVDGGVHISGTHGPAATSS